MPKYLVLYNAEQSAEAQMESNDSEQANEGMRLWMEWADRAGDALVDLGTPLATGQVVTADGTSPSSSKAAGYSIMQADSADQVVELLKGHPHLLMPGSTIEVFEGLELPGM
ncbi:hypothetical protein [Diaminobutyricimonas sp. LJ205]|uniref:hypothetical protein n=1 Tax=Diaminobutyricimonas sp. LJ205 TaxID=2683590 RepID=UPI0012F515E0|nr:hypothetical protein [Diaminobutyricimonas sp. LJ205]